MTAYPDRHYRCADTQTHVDEFVDCELGPHEDDRIADHLAMCPDCRAYFQQHMVVKSLVARACECPAVPADVQAQVLTRISQLRVTLGSATFESFTIQAEIRGPTTDR